MDIQTEYLISRNHVGPSQVTRNLFILLAIIVISYTALWYLEPDNAIVNLPYCLGDIVSGNPQNDTKANSIEGMYVAHYERKIEGDIIKTYLPNDTHVLRFDSSGQVMHAALKDYGHLNWRKVSIWFNWDSTDETIMRGEYKIEGDHIIFTTTSLTDSNLAIAWSGRISMDTATQQTTLFLIGPYADTLIFKFYNVGQCPFVIQK